MRAINELEYIEAELTTIKSVLNLTNNASFSDIVNTITENISGDLAIFNSIEERNNTLLPFKEGNSCMVYNAIEPSFGGIFNYSNNTWANYYFGGTASEMDVFYGNKAIGVGGVFSGGFYSEDHKKETIGIIENLWASIPEE